MSVTKISRGNQPVRIAPKPAVTSTEYPLATPVLASTGVMSAFDVQPMNLQILVAQTQSIRPAVQKCGDTVVQRTLLLSPDVSSGLEVTAQNPSLASPVVSLSETTPSLQSSGNMIMVPQNQPQLAVVTPSTSAISSFSNVVTQGQPPVPVIIQSSSTQAIYSSGKSQTQPSLAVAVPKTPPTQAMYGPGKILPQNQSPLVAAVPQTSSTQAFYSPGQILPQNQSPSVSAVPQTLSTQAMYSSGKILPQNQSPLVSAVPQTPSTQAMYSPGKILPRSQPLLVSAVPQTPSTQAMYSPGKILPRNQSQLAAAVPQTPSTSAINNTGTGNMVAQSLSPSLAAVSQTTSTLSIPGSSNMLPQNQSPLSGAVNQTSLTPALQSFDDMPPQTGLQTPPPIIISNNASTQPVQSFLNMQSQNQPPLAVVTPSTSAISTSNNVVEQGQPPVPVVIQNSSTRQAIHSSGKILPQNLSSLAAAFRQMSSTLAIYTSGKILPQNQSQLAAAVPQIPSTLAINNTGNMVAQSQSPSLAAVSQTPSTLSIPGSNNMLPQNQSPLSGAVNHTLLTPALQSFDDMPPQAGLQTPPPIIISGNSPTQPDQSFLNMQSQNQLPMMTDFNRSSHNVGMPTHSQPSSTVVSQTAPGEVVPQSSLSTYHGYSGNFSMPSYPNSAHMVSQPCSGPGSSLDESDRQFALKILQNTFFQSRPSLPPQQVCPSAGSAQQFNYRGLYNPVQFGPPTSDRSTQLPLNVLADATMLQEQTTNSTASSSHVQVRILSIFFVHD